MIPPDEFNANVNKLGLALAKASKFIGSLGVEGEYELAEGVYLAYGRVELVSPPRLHIRRDGPPPWAHKTDLYKESLEIQCLAAKAVPLLVDVLQHTNEDSIVSIVESADALADFLDEREKK